MAIKTFTDNISLPASDINTYLNNSGLVYITSVALTSTIQINNCFTSDYANYRVLVNIDTHSGGASNILMQLSTGGTPHTVAANYYYTGNEQTYATGAFVTFNSNGVQAFWVVGRLNGNDYETFQFEVQNPQRTAKKFYNTTYVDTGVFGRAGGLLNVTNSFDGMKLYHSTGHTITGTVRIYGYRQA